MMTDNKTKHRTRVVALPRLGHGIEIPAGFTPAYFRKRKGLAMLRSDSSKSYLVFSIVTGQFIEVRNTREASRTMSAIAKGEKTFSPVEDVEPK
jgi:hypothetical protein